MLGRIVEIAEDDRHLKVERGFLVVKKGSEEIGRIPLDDILAVVTHAHGLTYTNNLLVSLADRNIPFVLCAANHMPVGILLAVQGNYSQAKRFDAQIAASKPLNKRLWAEVVKTKISMQAAVLDKSKINSIPVEALITKVSSGDKSNVEAQAARRYWKLLYGSEFRRNRDAEDENMLLNYGYTVFRAACARAVLSAGLHPTLGIHHSNQSNSTRLVDDLIEPFRPIVDITVKQLIKQGHNQLSVFSKRQLVHCLYTDMMIGDAITPASLCMQRLATSLAQVYMGERNSLELPSDFIFN